MEFAVAAANMVPAAEKGQEKYHGFVDVVGVAADTAADSAAAGIAADIAVVEAAVAVAADCCSALWKFHGLPCRVRRI